MAEEQSAPPHQPAGAAEERRVLLDQLPQAAILYDAQTLQYVAVNQAAIDLYGWSREEFLAMTIADIHAPEDVARLRRVVSQSLGEPRQHGAWRHRTKAGAILFMDIHAQDHWEGARRLRLVIASDVTARVRLEEQLAESENAFRGFFESNPIPCVVVRLRDDAYTQVNGAFLSLMGLRREEALGHTSLGLGLWVNPSDRAPLLAELRARGVAQDHEIWFRARSGQEVLGLVSARIIELGGEPHLLGVIRDITERRRATEERLALLEELRQAQKMEAVGRLAGGVAHDFNNMLMVVTNVTDLLLSQLEPGAAMAEDLGQIREAASRATGLTRQLLAFSRKQVLQPRPLDPNQLVRELEKMLRTALTERSSLSLSLEPGLPQIKADPTQLTQVLLNLCINARDAMPEGGKVCVATCQKLLDAEEGRHRGDLPAGRYVQLSVIDSGLGMDPETQRRAFEPFFTTKGEAGTGLGLATVYGIVSQSGGSVFIESAPGQGAAFHVLLPALVTGAAE
jgi:two-component system, cell cycle sensor histidine kinase and response regulator CckA